MAEVGYSSYRPEGSGQVSDRYRARHGFEHTPAYQAEDAAAGHGPDPVDGSRVAGDLVPDQ